MTLGDEKYLLFTTFRRTGVPVSTPVWVVPLDDGRLGFWTSSESGKAKRLAHDDRATLQPCDARGRVRRGATAVDATARLATAPELETIRGQVRAKYGVMTKLTPLLGAVNGLLKHHRRPYGDAGVVVTPTA